MQRVFGISALRVTRCAHIIFYLPYASSCRSFCSKYAAHQARFALRLGIKRTSDLLFNNL